MNFIVSSCPFLNRFFFLKYDVQIRLIKEEVLREELMKWFFPILFGKRSGEHDNWLIWFAEYSLQASATQNYHSKPL